ncbi:hypothetical protein ACFPRL_20180 [Pseudoclavibacter helvolus]
MAWRRRHANRSRGVSRQRRHLRWLHQDALWSKQAGWRLWAIRVRPVSED